MNIKKKLKKFFTLQHRSNDGFTLVELIVVIAILAILAGVGSVGYAGYIKSANKGADKTLVGNVMRAIETGTYSTMFESGDSFKKALTTYPVGVIVLSADNGCEVASTSSTVQSSTDECVMGKITVVSGYTIKGFDNGQGILDKLGQLLNLTAPAHIDEYTITETKEIEYCVTHSNVPPQKEVATKVEQVSKMMGAIKYYDAKQKATHYFLDDCKGMYALATDHTAGDKVTTDTIVKDDTATNRVSVDNDSVLKDALKAAFGEDLSALKLSYDGWGDAADTEHTYPTLLTYTETMIGDIKDTAELLINAKNLVGNAMNLDSYLSDDYNNAADMMDSFANTVTKSFDSRDDWMVGWNAAANASNNRATFGLSSKLDHIYAARIAYNSSFASYCDANGADPAYLDVIKDYSNKDSTTGLLDIPCNVNTWAFNQTGDGSSNDETLKKQFADAGDTDGTAFEQYKALYAKYKDSEACRKNGEIFFDTMGTVAATGKEAYKTGSNDDYFKYYENMMQEMAAYYQLIESYDGKGIIILVTVEDGLVKCDVSPMEANPRND